MLGLAGHAAGNWLFFATGVSPAAMLASVTLAWTAVRSSLGLAPQWRASRRTAMHRYLLAMLVVVVAAGLAGCAGQSELQFFKAYGQGQVEQRYMGMNVIAVSVSQTDQASPLPKK